MIIKKATLLSIIVGLALSSVWSKSNLTATLGESLIASKAERASEKQNEQDQEVKVKKPWSDRFVNALPGTAVVGGTLKTLLDNYPKNLCFTRGLCGFYGSVLGVFAVVNGIMAIQCLNKNKQLPKGINVKLANVTSASLFALSGLMGYLSYRLLS